MIGAFQVGPYQNGVTFAFQQSGSIAPPAQEQQTPAGRRRRKRRYLVEIDGRDFYFDNVEQALDLLTRARALAKAQAERIAEKAVESDLPKAIQIGKAKSVELKAPKVTGSKELSPELKAAQEEIRRIYQDAALQAELRILMALDQERDDEEVILLSL